MRGSVTSNQATTRFCGSLRSICSSPLSLSLAVVDITTGGVPDGSNAPATVHSSSREG